MSGRSVVDDGDDDDDDDDADDDSSVEEVSVSGDDDCDGGVLGSDGDDVGIENVETTSADNRSCNSSIADATAVEAVIL
jgi:hypothetical protein